MRLTEAQYAALKAGRRVPKARRGERWTALFASHLAGAGIEFEREFRFASPRKFRFDFALHKARLAIEIDGGVHRIEARFKSDREKLNLATELNWRVFRFSPGEVRDGSAIAFIERVISK